MKKLYTTSLHLIFGLKESYCTETSIIRFSHSTKLCTLYFALHSTHFQPQIECRAQVFTRSMLLYWRVEKLQSVECRVQSFVKFRMNKILQAFSRTCKKIPINYTKQHSHYFTTALLQFPTEDTITVHLQMYILY